MDDKTKRTIAFHESGHALVGYTLPQADPVHKISIISRGRALGYTLSIPKEDKVLSTLGEMRDELAVFMGGRVAEEIFCDDISRLDMMNRIFIGRVIPLIVILCGLIWQLYISATDHSERGWLPVFIVLVIIYIITFLQFAVKYFAFRKNVK